MCWTVGTGGTVTACQRGTAQVSQEQGGFEGGGVRKDPLHKPACCKLLDGYPTRFKRTTTERVLRQGLGHTPALGWATPAGGITVRDPEMSVVASAPNTLGGVVSRVRRPVSAVDGAVAALSVATASSSAGLVLWVSSSWTSGWQPETGEAAAAAVGGVSRSREEMAALVHGDTWLHM